MHPQLAVVALLALTCTVGVANAASALVFNKNGQLTTSTTLAWQPFSGDEKQLQYAVRAGKILLESNQTYAVLVCRAPIEGVYITGHTAQHADDKTVCIVSMHMMVRTHHAFDVLLNKGHGAKLTWKRWNKFDPSIPIGAVSAVSAGHIEDSFVARRAAVLDPRNNEHHHVSVDYFVGRFAPKVGLGKVFVIEGREEKTYEEGEILAETDPVRYELRDIKVSKLRTVVVRNKTQLGAVQLQNDGESTNLVESVISYDYDRVLYWGTLEGVSRGIPTDVYETGKPVMQINWGLRETSAKTDTKAVNANLQPGTALNATISANYTKIEAPYKATLVSFYEDSNETLTRRVESTFLSADMVDLKYNFSPIYWLHNLTLVPTTTTTTTTTTSTTSTSTTPSTTSIAKEARPAHSPPRADGSSNGDDDDDDETSNSVDEEHITDGKRALSAAAVVPSASSGHLTQSSSSSSALLLTIVLAIASTVAAATGASV